jgi:LPS-assembly protein
MRKRLIAIALLVLLGLATVPAKAQFGSFGDVPIEINAESTGFSGGVATAEGNVEIRYGDVTIYCDYGEYNPETHDVLVRGNVRIYRQGRLFTGERALYNLETKQIRAADFRGDFYPLRFAGDTLSTLGGNAYIVRDGIMTTSDSSKPDYYFKAKTVRIYPKDRVVFLNAMLYVGKTPIFWFPYLYQSLNKDQAFTLTPGYRSGWGAFVLSTYTFPIADKWSGKLHLDLRSQRGVGVGLDSEMRFGKDDRSYAQFRSYYIDDSKPGTNNTGLSREPVDAGRYRIALDSKIFITDDIYAIIDVAKLSDRRIEEDFFETEFRLDPQPDNVIAVTKWDPNYTLAVIGRKQINNFFDMTERLPEVVLDLKRQPLFGSGIFYEGETGAGRFRRNFAKGSPFPDYDYTRADSFHQLLYPQTYGGWLSFTPKAGVRGTYYSDSGRVEEEVTETTLETLLPNGTPERTTVTSTDQKLHREGSVFRGVANAGFESSFKFSREFENVQSRMWGLDGLRHVVQPYTDLSFVYSSEDPNDILQIDRFQPSNRVPLFDFPQFTSTDSIDDWTVWRLGVRNRLQTRRDSVTFNWLEMDTFFNVNLQEPDFPGSTFQDGRFSNIYNRLRWSPLPWVGFALNTQLPLIDEGFSEVNSSVNFLVNRNIRLNAGQRYLSGNPFFEDSNLVTVGGYYQLNENWGFSVEEDYEFEDSTLESQRYQIHRDLSSWVASLGVIVRDNRGGESEYGILLTFTLKDFPAVSLPLGFDPQSGGDR